MNKGGTVVPVPPRSSTTRSRFGATTCGTEALSDGASDGPCRFCGAEPRHTFVDLGLPTLCESDVEASRVNAMDANYKAAFDEVRRLDLFDVTNWSLALDLAIIPNSLSGADR